MMQGQPRSIARRRVTGHRPRRGDAASPAAPSDSPSVPVRLLGRLTLVLVLDALALLALSGSCPGSRSTGPGAALGLALVLGVANAVVWPLLIRFALPFTVADARARRARAQRARCCWAPPWLLDDVQLDGLFEAVVVTLGLTLITTLVGGVLALDRGDLWYRHIVRRQPSARKLAEQTDVPGVVFLEIDGLAYDVLRRALRDGNAPGARALGARRRLPARSAGRPTGPRRPAPARPGCCTATTTTCPRSAGGRRTRGRAIVTNHPRDAAEIERRQLQRPRAALRRRRQPREHPLRRRAAQHADDEHRARPRPPGPARAGLLRLLRQPVRRRAHAAARDRRGLHRALRRRSSRSAATCARGSSATGSTRSCARTRPSIQLDLQVAAVTADVLAGPPGDLHDVPGLRRGRAPLGHRAARTRSRCCARVDHAIDRIAAAVEHAPRPYELVVLSDHGQSQGATFRQRYGEGLEDVVAPLTGGGEVRAEDAHSDEGLASFNAERRPRSPRRDTRDAATPCRTAAGKRLDEPEPTARHPGGLGDGLGQPRADLVPARAGPRHARADRRAPPRAAGRAARAPRDRVRARALRAPRRGRARPGGPAAAARRHASRATTRSRRSARSPPTTSAAPTASRTARTSSSTAPTGTSWRRSPRSRSSSARTAAWAAARRTRSCCTRRDLPWPAEPVVGAAAVHRILRGWLGRSSGQTAYDDAALERGAEPGYSIVSDSPGASVSTRVAAPARPRDARTPAAARVRTARCGGRGRSAGTCPSGSGSRSAARPARRPRRALGVEVARAERRSPAPDRDQRDVDLAAQRAHARRRGRCRRRTRRRRQVAERVVLERARAGPPAPVVPRGDDADLGVADLERLAGARPRAPRRSAIAAE